MAIDRIGWKYDACLTGGACLSEECPFWRLEDNIEMCDRPESNEDN